MRPLWISWRLKSNPITRFLSLYRKSRQQRWKQRISGHEIMIVLKAHRQNWIYRSKNCNKSTSGSKRNGQIRQLVRCQKKRNHLCFSLMQPHTIFNKKMQCNGFLPHVLLTRRPFQRLKYSVCPSVYTDDLIFTRKNRLIIAICCLYCRTNHLGRTNRLRPLIRLSTNTANEL